MRPVKVLHAGPMPDPRQRIGGIRVLISQILENWDLPYQCVSYNTDGPRSDFSQSGHLRLSNVLRFFRNVTGLALVLRRERPEIIHYHTSRRLALLKDLAIVWLIKLIFRVRVIGHLHWAVYDGLFIGAALTLQRSQIRLMLRLFDRLILMSQNIKGELAARLSVKDRKRLEEKARILYNFTPVPALPSDPDPGTRPMTLLFVGNVVARKGVFDLITASRALRAQGLTSFRLILAGPCYDAATEEKLKSAIEGADLGEAVRLIGLVLGPAKERLFLNADIFVLPTYGEGLPMSLLEAMSYALPVVTTPVGGIPELVTDRESGFLIAPGDVAGLSLALTKLISAPELRSRMGRCGRTWVEQRHSPERYFRVLGSIYDEVLNR